MAHVLRFFFKPLLPPSLAFLGTQTENNKKADGPCGVGTILLRTATGDKFLHGSDFLRGTNPLLLLGMDSLQVQTDFSTEGCDIIDLQHGDQCKIAWVRLR